MRTAPVNGIVLLFLFACDGGSLPPAASASTSTIARVQGDGDISPFVGEVVTIDGIVTGDFQDRDADSAHDLGGFYVQDESPDGDLSTSDAVFVFDDAVETVDVRVGDRVRIVGTVAEFFGETQIKTKRVTVTGRGHIQPTALTLPFSSLERNSDGQEIPDLEALEGMLVAFPQTLTVTDLFNLERFGEMRLSQGGRLYQFTNDNEPDSSGYAAQRERNILRSIVVDDGRRERFATPIKHLGSGANATRLGATIRGLTGNLRYARGSGRSGTETWRLMPQKPPAMGTDNPRPGTPDIDGNLVVASFNVLNLFSTIDRGQSKCGPAKDSGCRGADSDDELSRQVGKIVTALAMMNADIVGLVELENNAAASLQILVNALNERLGANSYAYVDSGVIGDDTIKVGLLFKPDRVKLRGRFAILDSGVDRRFNDRRNRPALAQSFSALDSGETLTVVVMHLKSKGQDCDTDGDRNLGDGQGNCNRTRNDAALALVAWLQADPTASRDPDFLLIGDQNSYAMEDPIRTFEKGGLVNLVDAARAGNEYSFVFDGQAGALDHALATSSLAAQMADAFVWHINADEAPLRDYNLDGGRDDALFDPRTPYRASDHDPILLGFDLGT